MTNFMRFHRSADHWRWAPHEDAVALDIHPDPGQADAHVATGVDLLTGERAEGTVTLAPLGVAVIEVARP